MLLHQFVHTLLVSLTLNCSPTRLFVVDDLCQGSESRYYVTTRARKRTMEIGLSMLMSNCYLLFSLRVQTLIRFVIVTLKRLMARNSNKRMSQISLCVRTSSPELQKATSDLLPSSKCCAAIFTALALWLSASF